VSALKIVALVLNVAIAVYLLFAKRLFGIGGAAADRAERERDSGWDALERTGVPGRAAVGSPAGAGDARRGLTGEESG
jgi:hypothetical protein